MKAKSPIDGKIYYFLDKCLPFGGSISCSHFQRFSNALAHIVKVKSGGKDNVNYLDDFLFIALMQLICNNQVRTFLAVCKEINFPVAVEKTFWGTNCLVFLGLLIDTLNQCVSIPTDKVQRAVNLVSAALQRKKITVKQLQKICGFLNFLGRCVIPGRAFTRRLYAYTGKNMKPHYHIRLNQELRKDLNTWLVFLEHPGVFCRPFLDFSENIVADEINFYTDASGKIGLGGICDRSWMREKWSKLFLSKHPSIEYLELFAVVCAVLKWIHRFKNRRVILFCDNKSVCGMINHTTTSCKNCMVLIRILVLKSMIENVRVFAQYVKSSDNIYADALSRDRISYFKRIGKNKFENLETEVPSEIWPPEKIWIKV